MVVITDFPLAISVNKAYPTIGGRRVRSGDYKKFLVYAARWKGLHMGQLLDIEEQLRSWMREGYQLRVDSWFCFLHERLYTKKNEVKALDSHNFTKSLHDALAELLNIDDRHFFAGLAEKVSTSTKEEECTILRITPHLPQTKDSILLSLRATAAGASARSNQHT